MEFNERTKLAIELAKIAGKEIKRIRDEEDIETKGKGVNDVVTVADIRSEKIITTKINEMFPNDTIIAEESGKNTVGNNEYSWAIDPLDGTLNYSRGMPTYCVSIGYMKDNKPYGGAVYIPELDELYYGEKGKGAYCNGKKISVSKETDISKSLAVIGFNNRFPEKREFYNKVHNKCMYQMVNAETLFSTVINLCYVASGKIDAELEVFCFVWDICAGSLFVEEAGGKCSTVNYEPLDYSKLEKQIIISTNGNIHQEFEDIVNG